MVEYSGQLLNIVKGASQPLRAMMKPDRDSEGGGQPPRIGDELTNLHVVYSQQGIFDFV